MNTKAMCAVKEHIHEAINDGGDCNSYMSIPVFCLDIDASADKEQEHSDHCRNNGPDKINRICQ